MQDDRRASLAALIAAALMIAQQVGGKATRDALFLSSFAPEDLPRVVIAAAAVSLVAVLLATRAFAHRAPVRIVPLAFALSSVLHAVEWVFAEAAPRAVAVALYLHAGIFGALVISGFWSVVNERFDPHTAKQVVGRIGVGAAMGGVLGGILAERIGAAGQTRWMLLALALLGALAAVFVARIGAAAPHPRALTPAMEPPLEVLRKTPYLRALALLVVLTAAASTLLDYALKAEAARELSAGELLSFFARFHMVTAVLSLALQATVVRRALLRLGVGGTVAILPAIVALTAMFGAAVTRLWAIVLARGAELVLANSVFRSGYELLYTPVAPHTKRPTKALIDVAGQRIGDALGSGLVLLLIALVPMLPHWSVPTLAAVFAIASLMVARRLHGGYVAELEATLRSGARPDPMSELSLSTFGLEREALFEQIAAHGSWAERLSHPSADEAQASAPPIDAPPGDPIHEKANLLVNGAADVVRRALAEGPLDRRLVPAAITLLGRRDLYPDALAALRGVAEQSIDTLARVLSDASQPVVLRRRIPRVLESCRSEQAVGALIVGLDDERFEVRHRCVLALGRIAARVPALTPDEEAVLRALARELDEPSPGVEAPRRIEHVFALLGLAYDAEALRLALHALRGSDNALRGTALEYLENVLPESLHQKLWKLLQAPPHAVSQRSKEELARELARSVGEGES